MQILIDIDEKDYNDAKTRVTMCGTELLESANGRFAYSIANGTPLPKGHGRLIDGDYLYKKFKANKCPDENVYRFIREEPTVIEAEEFKFPWKYEFKDEYKIETEEFLTSEILIEEFKKHGKVTIDYKG